MKKILVGWMLGVLMMGSSAMAEEQIINNTSAKCLDTTGQAANGAVVRMWNCTNHPNQLWEIISIPNAGQRLKNKATGFCLDVYSGNVRMWQCTNKHQ
ncbi:RICIN domain-containing protein, partial [Desulfobulbus sp. F4]|nr:RICIN domain-containing protein [Desulfobulbus sp. F4]